MKRLGVQIAAGAVTILLGVLAAAHAQKDRDDAPDTEWKSGDVAELRQAPKPIEEIGDSPADEPDHPGRSTAAEEGSAHTDGVDSPIESESPPIRLVQHTDSLDSQGAFQPPGSLGPPAADEKKREEVGTREDSGAAGAFGDVPSFGMPSSLGFEAPQSDPPRTEASQVGPSQAGGDQSQTVDSTAYPAGAAPDAVSGTESTRDTGVGDAMGVETRMPKSAFGEPPAMSLPGLGGESETSSQPRQAFDQGETPRPRETTEASDDDFDSLPINGLREPADSSEYADGIVGASDEGTSPPVADHAPRVSSAGMSETTPPRLASLSEETPRGIETPQRRQDANSERVAESRGMKRIDHASRGATDGLPRDNGGFVADLPSRDASERGLNGNGPSGPGVFAADPHAGGPRTLDSPGDRRLEGAQTPSLVIQKRAPSEVKVGKPASFVISIRNVGSVEAIDVRLHDQVPVGMRLADASPSPVRQGEELVWHLGALPAGDERTVTMQLVPEQEGELGSVARVSFEAAASVRTMSTRPELKIVQRAPEAVLIGQQLEIELEVSNPGTGEAVGVVLQEDVPEGLEHPKGSQLDNLLGNLQPGEVRREVLRLRAVAPGQIQNKVRLVSEDGLIAEHTVDVEVIAPQLRVGLNGPTRRYVERQATYDVRVTNAGTAEASNVEIAAYLDRGFTFVSTENQGQYDPNRHAVFWSLARLPEGADATVPLTLLPVNVGEQAIRVEANADLGAEGRHEQTVAVDSLAELTFRISDASDPIEMGAETAYEIRVTNSGSRDDANVRVELELPAGLELLSSDADAEQDDRGRVYFEPREKLEAGGELTYRIKVRGVAPGRHVTKATVVSDQSGVAVTKEESTMVYADR